MMNCYKSSFQECITIIVLKIKRTRNQSPYCLLQLQEKMAFRPRSGCLGTSLTLPQSLYGRTYARWRQNQNFSDQRVTKFAYPWCSASSAVRKLGDTSKAATFQTFQRETKICPKRWQKNSTTITETGNVIKKTSNFSFVSCKPWKFLNYQKLLLLHHGDAISKHITGAVAIMCW